MVIRPREKIIYLFEPSWAKMNNKGCTEYFPCNIGTRQGCKLSHILFIKDIFDRLRQSGIRGVHISTESEELLAFGFADDIAKEVIQFESCNL